MLILGIVMLTMQGEVKSWLGLAAAVQFTPWSILSTRSLLTQIATCSLSPIYKRVLLSLCLLFIVSSMRPPNYNTSLLPSELTVTCSRQLPDCRVNEENPKRSKSAVVSLQGLMFFMFREHQTAWEG
jgi:hypothetical protein